MEKEFIPYEQALTLKELGFDEPCRFHYYTWLGKYEILDNEEEATNEQLSIQAKKDGISLNTWITAPLYQQAFRWFKEKYRLHYYITTHDETDYEWYVYDKDQNDWEDDTTQNTYEEAELKCLKKLIEIVKKQQEYESNIIV